MTSLEERRARNRVARHKHYHTRQIRRFESELETLQSRAQEPDIVLRSLYVKLQIANHLEAIRTAVPRRVDRLTLEEMDRLAERIQLDPTKSKEDKDADLVFHEQTVKDRYMEMYEAIKTKPRAQAEVYYTSLLAPRYDYLMQRNPGRTDIPMLKPLDELMGEARKAQDISESTGEPKEPIETTVEDWQKARETKHQHFSPDDIFSEIGTNAKVVLIHSAKNRQ